MNIFDWLHDVSKGEDTFRPKIVKVPIAIIIFVFLSALWGLLRNILH